MKSVFTILIILSLLIGCSGGNSPSCESHIVDHYLTNWDFEIIDIVEPNKYIELRLEFANCDANIKGVWGQFYTDNSDNQGPAYFYEAKPASVGSTLYWPNGVPEDTWVDVWLENLNGTFSPVYTLLVDVE